MSLATEIAGKLNYLNVQDKVAVNATLPYSGYTQVSRKLDNFIFQTSSSFLNKVADKNRYVKFGDKVVDTYGPELVTNGQDWSTGWSLVGGAIGTLGNTATVNRNNHAFGAGIEYTVDIKKGSTYLVELDIISSYFMVALYFSDDDTIDFNINNGTGTKIVVLKAIRNYSSFRIVPTGNMMASFTIDNISIREIQTAQFTVPNVTEIITDGSNTTMVSVNAGDYVVDDSELIVNGKFDTDTSGWANTDTSRGTISYSSGKIRVTNDGTNNYPNASQQLTNLIPGNRYIVKADIDIGTSTRAKLYSYLLGSTDATSSGKYSLVFTATSSSHNVVLYNYETGNTGSYVEFDNISVRRVSDTFRAKQDAPIGTALTNTAYFEDRTQIGVTNQQLAYHAYNTLTNVYEGIKTEVLFSDVSKEDLLDNSVWMAINGFSKVSEFLYSKGSYLCLPIGIWQSLNNGAYHPFLNPFGTRTTYGNAGREFWFTETTKEYLSAKFVISDTSGNASVTSGYLSSNNLGRPDSKFYDIVYPDQFIDVREYAKVLTNYEVDLIRADKEENGVEEVVSMLFSGNATLSLQFSATDIQPYITYALRFPDGTFVNDTITSINGIGYIKNNSGVWVKVYGIRQGRDVLLNTNSGFTNATSYTLAVTSTKPILSSNTKLSTDLIGNPTNYPQVMKDRFAEGKGIIGINPLLVGEDGTSYISGTSITAKFSKKIIGAMYNTYYTISNGTYGNEALAYTAVTNSKSSIDATNYVNIINYTSKNNPYIQTTPKPVVEVLPKVKASNSHSIYKGALVGNQVAGKIQVGNGTNGYESKVLENAEVISGSIITIPTSNTIALDNANSPASKWFECLEEGNNGVLAGVYGQEVMYGACTGNFANLSNGTITDFSNNTVRTFHGSIPLNGKIK